jgi:hypothetical protein
MTPDHEVVELLAETMCAAYWRDTAPQVPIWRSLPPITQGNWRRAARAALRTSATPATGRACLTPSPPHRKPDEMVAVPGPLCPMPGDGRHKLKPWSGYRRSGFACVACSKTWEHVGREMIATWDLLFPPKA